MKVGECDTCQWLLGGTTTRDATYSFYFEAVNNAGGAGIFNGATSQADVLQEKEELEHLNAILNQGDYSSAARNGAFEQSSFNAPKNINANAGVNHQSGVKHAHLWAIDGDLNRFSAMNDLDYVEAYDDKLGKIVSQPVKHKIPSYDPYDDLFGEEISVMEANSRMRKKEIYGLAKAGKTADFQKRRRKLCVQWQMVYYDWRGRKHLRITTVQTPFSRRADLKDCGLGFDQEAACALV